MRRGQALSALGKEDAVGNDLLQKERRWLHGKEREQEQFAHMDKAEMEDIRREFVRGQEEVPPCQSMEEADEVAKEKDEQVEEKGILGGETICSPA